MALELFFIFISYIGFCVWKSDSAATLVYGLSPIYIFCMNFVCVRVQLFANAFLFVVCSSSHGERGWTLGAGQSSRQQQQQHRGSGASDERRWRRQPRHQLPAHRRQPLFPRLGVAQRQRPQLRPPQLRGGTRGDQLAGERQQTPPPPSPPPAQQPPQETLVGATDAHLGGHAHLQKPERRGADGVGHGAGGQGLELVPREAQVVAGDERLVLPRLAALAHFQRLELDAHRVRGRREFVGRGGAGFDGHHGHARRVPHVAAAGRAQARTQAGGALALAALQVFPLQSDTVDGLCFGLDAGGVASQETPPRRQSPQHPTSLPWFWENAAGRTILFYFLCRLRASHPHLTPHAATPRRVGSRSAPPTPRNAVLCPEKTNSVMLIDVQVHTWKKHKSRASDFCYTMQFLMSLYCSLYISQTHTLYSL